MSTTTCRRCFSRWACVVTPTAMRRRRSYSNSGQHRLSMHQGSHALQRSVSGTLSRTSSYRTTSQRELIARASSDGPRSASWGGGDAEPQLRGSFSASLGGQRPSRRMARGTSQRDLMAGGGGGGAAGTSGRLIGGRYRVQEHRCIGGGGTSRVYEATDEENGEPCAVKTMDGKHDRLQASVHRWAALLTSVRRRRGLRRQQADGRAQARG